MYCITTGSSIVCVKNSGVKLMEPTEIEIQNVDHYLQKFLVKLNNLYNVHEIRQFLFVNI